MSKIKQVSFLLRVTPEEKSIILEKADKENLSMTEFIKRRVLNDDINNDINNDIIDILREQLKTKDMQISNLQQIIYNRDTKLIETLETSNKKWWKFWK